ncbi:MAG: ABC transporter substrate-binding protein [Nitrososphaerota archaeon]
MGEKKINRRDYLKYTGAAIGGLVVGGALGYLAKPAEVVEKTVTAPGTTVTIPGTTVTVPKTITITGVPTTTVETITTVAETTEYTFPPEPKTPIKLSVWLWGTFAPAIDALNKIAYIWNRDHPKVQIEFTPIAGLSSLEFTLKCEQATAAGEGPDIMHNEDHAMASWIYDGYAELLPEEMQALAKKYIHPSFLDGVYFWGPDVVRRMYVLPGAYGVNPTKHTWINDYHVEEAGLKAGWNPSDWDELIEVAQKMTKYDSAGNLVRSGLFVRVGGHVAGIFDKITPLLRTEGAKVIWAEGGEWKTDMDSDIAKKVIQRLYLDVIYKYKIYDPGFPGDVDAFAKELVSIVHPRELRETVMSIRTVNPERFIGPEGPKGFHGAPHPPESKGTKPLSYIDAHTWCVNSKIPKEKKDWAFAFLAWYMTDSVVKGLLFNAIGNMTIFRDVMESPPFTNPWYQQMLKVSMDMDPISRVVHPMMAQVSNAGGTVLSRIYLREVDLDRGLRELGTAVRDAMKQAPAPKG